MRQEELDFVLEQNEYLEGETKEACVKVKEFLNYATSSEKQIESMLSCVTAYEVVEAVKVLMAFAFLQSDTVPKHWKCDVDCRRRSAILCPGECNVSKSADNMCPFFVDEGLI